VKVDVCIIGAGPAGLSAAEFLASRGKRTVIIDEAPEAGGRLLGQLHRVGNRNDEYHDDGWWNGRRIARQLTQRATDAGAEILLGRSVWGLTPGWDVMLSGPGPDMITADAVVLATGASEIPVPVKGWTLPGVISVGAAQVMVTQYRVRPGNRALIAGINPLSMAIAHELQLGGVEVAGLVNLPRNALADIDCTPGTVIKTLSGSSHLAPTRALRMAGKLGKLPGASWLGERVLPDSGVSVWGIPVMPTMSLLEVTGQTEVSSALIGRENSSGQPSKVRAIEVDTVCISGGLRPLSELALLAGTPIVNVPDLGGNVPVHNRSYETGIPGIYVAGNVTGIESAPIAIAQGRVVAAAIADQTSVETLKAEEERQRASSPIDFMPRINEGRLAMQSVWDDNGAKDQTSADETSQVYVPASARGRLPVTDEVVLCRCEDVVASDLLSAYSNGLISTEELKRFSRVTMGQCQGRICGGILKSAAGRLHNLPVEAAPIPGHRPPIRPILLSDLARRSDGAEEKDRLGGSLNPEMPFDP
jgi:sarcosine oxidase, subunit alpha